MGRQLVDDGGRDRQLPDHSEVADAGRGALFQMGAITLGNMWRTTPASAPAHFATDTTLTVSGMADDRPSCHFAFNTQLCLLLSSPTIH